MKDKFTQVALKIGVAIPLVYFGIQLLAAPFYPGYSFLRRDASTLGSEGSNFPLLFNTGAIILGLLVFIATYGFFHALRNLKVNLVFNLLVCIALASFGISDINAGIHPMPSPLHTSGTLAMLGNFMLLLPVLLPLVVWKIENARRIRAYLIINLLMMVPFALIMSGQIQRWGMEAGWEMEEYQYFLNNCQGLIQRFGVMIVIVPIGVVAYFLRKRVQGKDPLSP
jgi:hypothetical membrane protein